MSDSPSQMARKIADDVAGVGPNPGADWSVDNRIALAQVYATLALADAVRESRPGPPPLRSSH